MNSGGHKRQPNGWKHCGNLSMTSSPHLSDDLKDLIKLFIDHGLEFMIVGGHALAVYGHPRFTRDLDVFIERDRENVRRLASAIAAFGIVMSEASQAEMTNNPDAMIRIGAPPNQVDVLNNISGVTFEECAPQRMYVTIGEIDVPFISLQDFVRAKKASGRDQDIEDLKKLKRLGVISDF